MNAEEIRSKRLPNNYGVVIDGIPGAVVSAYYDGLLGDVVYCIARYAMPDDFVSHKTVTGKALTLDLNDKQRRMIDALKEALTIK